VPQQRSLFQRPWWPVDKGRTTERSPRWERSESSRQGGKHLRIASSLSPAPRRSRERSLDRPLQQFRRCDARLEKRHEAGLSPVPNCRSAPVAAAAPVETVWQCLGHLSPLMRWTSSCVFAVLVVTTFLILIQCCRKFRWRRPSASGHRRSCCHPRWWWTLD
jgi:hypothetical protein